MKPSPRACLVGINGFALTPSLLLPARRVVDGGGGNGSQDVTGGASGGSLKVTSTGLCAYLPANREAVRMLASSVHCSENPACPTKFRIKAELYMGCIPDTRAKS